MKSDGKTDNRSVKNVMSQDVALVTPDTALHEVARTMQERDCGCVLVGQDDRLVGVITDRDLALRCVAEGLDPVKTTAAQVMSPDILYCYETDVTEAVTRNMGDQKVRRLAVLNGNKRLVGIVTLGDLAQGSDPKLCGEALGTICRAAA